MGSNFPNLLTQPNQGAPPMPQPNRLAIMPPLRDSRGQDDVQMVGEEDEGEIR